MNSSIYITGALNHMHYMGRSQKVEVFRNGVKVRDIAKDEEYSYDSPHLHEFHTPVEILPGDRVDTTCVFTSKDNDKTVYYGEGTSDEMCFSFLWFYPAEAMPDHECISWKGLQYCAKDVKGKGVNECHPYAAQYDPVVVELMKNVTDGCKNVGECVPECKNAIKKAKEHTCFKGGDVTDMFIEENLQYLVDGVVFLVRFLSCDERLEGDPDGGDNNGSDGDTDLNTAAIRSISFYFYVSVMMAYIWT